MSTNNTDKPEEKPFKDKVIKSIKNIIIIGS